MKKRPCKLEDNEVIELIDLYDLSDYIVKLLNTYTMQIENKENVLPFYFECQVDISTLNNLEKQIGDILVEHVEDVDEFV